jgi:putative flippase GtrA
MSDRRGGSDPMSTDLLRADASPSNTKSMRGWSGLIHRAVTGSGWGTHLDLLANNSKEVGRFLRFCVVGIIGAIVDFGTLNLLVQRFGLAKVWANTCSFSLAVCSNFLWNRYWTYPETRGDPVLPQVTQFVLVNLVGLGINQAIFLSLDRWAFPNWGALGYNAAKIIATGVVLFWNFGANRLWTYRHI